MFEFTNFIAIYVSPKLFEAYTGVDKLQELIDASITVTDTDKHIQLTEDLADKLRINAKNLLSYQLYYFQKRINVFPVDDFESWIETIDVEDSIFECTEEELNPLLKHRPGIPRERIIETTINEYGFVTKRERLAS